MRGLVCDLSERALFFKCMVVRLCWHFCNFPWLCKVFLHIILQLGGHFIAWRPCLAAKGKRKTFLQPILKNRNILAAHFEAWKSFCSYFEVWKIILQSNWEFRSPFLKLGAFSHFKKIFAPWKGFFALWISRCEISAQLCVVCLQTAITSSFQIQIMHRLKHWIPDFPSFNYISYA